jgi:nitroreductase
MTPPSDLVELIRARRVCRNMTDEPVDPDDLATLARSARWAPNAGNRRLQPTIEVTDPTILRHLRSVSPGMLARPQAAIVVCIDLARATEYGFAPTNPGLYIDVGTTAATVMLTAFALGLASQPVTSFSRVAAARLLGLAPGLEPRFIVCLGHAATHQPPAMGGWTRSVLDAGDVDLLRPALRQE